MSDWFVLEIAGPDNKLSVWYYSILNDKLAVTVAAKMF